jgi:hypothetical protein
MVLPNVLLIWLTNTYRVIEVSDYHLPYTNQDKWDKILMIVKKYLKSPYNSCIQYYQMSLKNKLNTSLDFDSVSIETVHLDFDKANRL